MIAGERIGPDLLRKEAFGGLYYHRAAAEFSSLPPQLAWLLVEGTRRSVVELYAEAPETVGMDEAAFIRTVVQCQRRGLLDDQHRCRAEVIEGDTSHGGLMGPMVTNVQLTKACNLRCEHCYVDITAKPHPDELSTDQIRGLFGALESVGSPIVVLAGGEPLLRRDLFEIADAVGRHRLDAALCTNATFIDAALAAELAATPIRWFSISLDGPDAASHDAIRGPGRFEDTLEGIRNLAAAGAHHIKLRVTVTPHCAGRLAEFAEVATGLGVHSVSFKPFRHTETGSAKHAAHLYIDRSRYLDAIREGEARWPADAPPATFNDGMPQGPPAWTKVIPQFGCVGGTTAASVMYDGRVVACDAVLDPADWSLHQHSFQSCWQHAPTIASWRSLQGNAQCGGCSTNLVCRGGCRARAIAAGHTMRDRDPWAYCTEEETEAPRRALPILR